MSVSIEAEADVLTRSRALQAFVREHAEEAEQQGLCLGGRRSQDGGRRAVPSLRSGLLRRR